MNPILVVCPCSGTKFTVRQRVCPGADIMAGGEQAFRRSNPATPDAGRSISLGIRGAASRRGWRIQRNGSCKCIDAARNARSLSYND